MSQKRKDILPPRPLSIVGACLCFAVALFNRYPFMSLDTEAERGIAIIKFVWDSLFGYFLYRLWCGEPVALWPLLFVSVDSFYALYRVSARGSPDPPTFQIVTALSFIAGFVLACLPKSWRWLFRNHGAA